MELNMTAGDLERDLRFDWFEYIVFAVMLLLSTLIGVFFWCFKGGQNTVAEYYLGNKQMSIFPVAMSLVASFISGITLLGLPSEIYHNGSQIVLANFAELFIFLANVTIYQPVFYNLQLISLFEYLEMRFDHRVRVLASALFAVSWMLFLPVVMYGPVLAFNQVSGLSLHVISPIICLVCIFYTSVGGLKAVVWADALQGSVMLMTVIIVVLVGLSKVGGIAAVMTAAVEGQRIEFFNMNPDPTVRLTFWSSTIGIAFLWSSDITSPVCAQRYFSLPSLNAARKAAFCYLLGMCSFYLLSAFLGLIIYTHYQHCDPSLTKSIDRPDQILPFFIMDVVGHLKGVPGLFVSGIVCAALSSLSTGMNTLSGTFYEDFIEPLIGKRSEKTASNIMKGLTVIIGIICTALVSVVDKLGNIVDMGAAVGGVTNGCIFAIFTMGVLIPRVNAKGAFYGGLIAALFMVWTMLGHELSEKCVIKKPVSIDGCPNITMIDPIAEQVCVDMSSSFKTAFPLHRLTAFFYGLLGTTVTITMGIIISYITGFNDPASVKQELLSPLIRNKKTKENKTEYSEVLQKIDREA